MKTLTEGFDQIYKDNYTKVFTFIYNITTDWSLTEDITQEAFLKAYKNIDSFRQESKISVWLNKIAYNLLLDYKRKKSSHLLPVENELLATCLLTGFYFFVIQVYLYDIQIRLDKRKRKREGVPVYNKCSQGEGQVSNQCSGVPKRGRVCSDGVRYVQKELTLPPKRAVLACEGGCVKGEVARVAANILAYRLERDAAVRICLGDAATGDSGMFELVTRAPEVIAVEGCPLQCGTEIMRRRIPELQTSVINASELYEFDRSKYFEIFDMPRSELEGHAQRVAEYIQGHFFLNRETGGSASSCCCSREIEEGGNNNG